MRNITARKLKKLALLTYGGEYGITFKHYYRLIKKEYKEGSYGKNKTRGNEN